MKYNYLKCNIFLGLDAVQKSTMVGISWSLLKANLTSRSVNLSAIHYRRQTFDSVFYILLAQMQGEISFSLPHIYLPLLPKHIKNHFTFFYFLQFDSQIFKKFKRISKF